MNDAAFDGRPMLRRAEHGIPAFDRRTPPPRLPLKHDVVLEVAPYKTASLTAWLSGSWIAASVTGLGIVTVPANANRKAELNDVVEGVRAWMLEERDDAVFATYGNADLWTLGATRSEQR